MPAVIVLTFLTRAAIVASLIVIGAGTEAIGETTKGLLAVSATVAPRAEITTLAPLSFGGSQSTEPVAPPLTVRATKGLRYRIHVASVRPRPGSRHGRIARAPRTRASGDAHTLTVTIDW